MADEDERRSAYIGFRCMPELKARLELAPADLLNECPGGLDPARPRAGDGLAGLGILRRVDTVETDPYRPDTNAVAVADDRRPDDRGR